MSHDNEGAVMWKEEVKLLNEKSKPYKDKENLIAFYGSSSIRMWENMGDDLAPHQVVNLGFGGSSYRWCNYFFEEVFEFINPKKIVLYAGDNDLGTETPLNEILGHILSLINKIKRKYGDIPIAIISVKPSPDRLNLKEKIEGLNAELLSITRNLDNGIYVNIYREMLNFDGTVRPELFLEDQLHLNLKGYELWKAVIKVLLDADFKIES